MDLIKFSFFNNKIGPVRIKGPIGGRDKLFHFLIINSVKTYKLSVNYN